MRATTTGDRDESSPGPRSRGSRTVLLAVAALVVVGTALLVAGLTGDTTPRAAAPIASADGRPPVPVAAATTPTPSSVSPTVELPASPPRSIDIPAIGVRSVINPSGLDPDGALSVPPPGPRYDEAAWYTGSVTPGQSGPSVILGHIDSAANGPSVFYRLSQLRPLDEFSVTRSDGTTAVFKVNSVRQYPKNSFPTDEVYGPTTRPEVRLITCGGAFDDRARSYRDNTVVYANLISS